MKGSAFSVRQESGRVELPQREFESDFAPGFTLHMDRAAALVEETGVEQDASVLVLVHLVPRPDNEFNSLAVSICAPPNGQTLDDRLLGYIHDSYIGAQGQRLLHELARCSKTGEISCHAFFERNGTFLDFALPEPKELKSAIRAFLSRPSTMAPSVKPDLFTLLGLERPQAPEDITREALQFVHQFSTPMRSLGELHLSATLNSNGSNEGIRRRARSLRIRSSDHELIGEVALGLLFLEDERDRPEVLKALSKLDVPVKRPLRSSRTFSFVAPGDWKRRKVPNLRTKWYEEGYDFELVDPESDKRLGWVAQYHPTSQTLFVEAEALVAASREYAARLGLAVKDIKTPRQSWNLEDEVRFGVRRDVSLRPPGNGKYDWHPSLLRTLRSSLPKGLVPRDEVYWVDPPAQIASLLESDPSFSLHEAHVEAREYLFPRYQPTGRATSCRLCGRPGTEFTFGGCARPLSYCHECLSWASGGSFRSTDSAVVGVKLISRHEFQGAIPLKQQIGGIRSEPDSAPELVDVLALSRFSVKRFPRSWTELLRKAGLLKEGLRRGRGVVIEARDGHLCHSLLEKAVDDFMSDNGLEHAREPHYPHDEELNPRSLRRADWRLHDGTLVEMWGMPDDPAYALKMAEKVMLAKKHGIRLIELTADDIPNLSRILRRWLQ